jgi:hypothetical protein
LRPWPSIAWACWAALIVAWSLLALCDLVWVAAMLATKIMGGRAQPCSIEFFKNISNGSAHRDWPHTPTAAVVIVAILLAAVVVTLAGFLWRMATRVQPRHGEPAAKRAREPRLRRLTRRPATRTATGLRRSPAKADPGSVQPAETRLEPGRLIQPGKTSVDGQVRDGRFAAPASRDASGLRQNTPHRTRGWRR